jgi:hypothetical protein
MPGSARRSRVFLQPVFSFLFLAMKKIASVLAFLIVGITGVASAAISVGPNGNGTITFNALPAVGDWSTLLNSGGSGSDDIIDAAGLDTAVQTNVASAIATELGSSPTTAPAISSASIARWNSALLLDCRTRSNSPVISRPGRRGSPRSLRTSLPNGSG